MVVVVDSSGSFATVGYSDAIDAVDALGLLVIRARHPDDLNKMHFPAVVLIDPSVSHEAIDASDRVCSQTTSIRYQA